MLLRVFVGVASIAAITACRAERASVEDLYTTRMLGLSYLQRNQLPEAEAEFKKLTKLAPDDPLGYANLGMEPSRARKLLPILSNGALVFLFAPNEQWIQSDPWVTASAE